jgi:hypothetical protein
MKRFFTFGVMFLLSFMMTISFASSKTELKGTTNDGLILPGFSSADDKDEIW